MARISIAELEGGAELCAWFGAEPTFHDATLREFELRQGAPSRLVAHTFQMGSETDARGFFVLTRHVVVTLTLFDLIAVDLSDFREAAILFGLVFESNESGITLSFESSYGVSGWVA